MRLTLVISALTAGGAERVLSTMANFWADEGRDVTILTLDNRARPFYDLDRRIDYRPLELASASASRLEGFLRGAGRVLALRRSIQSTRPDAVVSFIGRTNVFVLLATVGMQTPVIVSERIDPGVFHLGRHWDILRSITYRRASAVVVQTENARRFFSQALQRRTVVIPNPVAPAGPEPRSERRPDSEKIVVGMGRLVEQKGFDLLVRAFAAAIPVHPEWKLQIWGEGPKRKDLEDLVHELNIAERVSLPGVTSEAHARMREADLFVLSSRFEGFPNVLCEAMAVGLPVVSFDCPSGPGDIIRDGVDGILVPPEDVSALAGALGRLMTDEQERVRLGAHARTIVRRLSVEQVMARWDNVLDVAVG